MDAETIRVTNRTAKDVVQRDKVTESETTMQYGDKIIHKRHWGSPEAPAHQGVIKCCRSFIMRLGGDVERWKVKSTSQLYQADAEDARGIQERMLHRDTVAPAFWVISVLFKFKRPPSSLLIRARLLCLHTTRATLRA